MFTVCLDLLAPTDRIPNSPAAVNVTAVDAPVAQSGETVQAFKLDRGLTRIEKRDTSRKIDTCPDSQDPYFIKSTCDHTSGSPDAKAFKLTCNYRPVGSLQYRTANDAITAGTCAQNEFCIQNDNAKDADSVAYCVSNSNMINLITAGQSGNGHRRVTVSVNKGSADSVLGQTLDALVTTKDLSQVIKMDNIVVAAQAVDTMNGQDSYRAQIGGTNACNGCSSIGLETVPDQTGQITFEIGFTGVTKEASLWIDHWSH